MGTVSKHFSMSEFACKCRCSMSLSIAPDLLQLLEYIRLATGEPILITSGARCKKHNTKVGGAPNSWHVPRYGTNTLYASDITYWDSKKRDKMGILELYIHADKYGANGIGLYDGRIHVDQRPTKRARWTDSSWSWPDGA
jgi:hypothetical protein